MRLGEAVRQTTGECGMHVDFAVRFTGSLVRGSSTLANAIKAADGSLTDPAVRRAAEATASKLSAFTGADGHLRAAGDSAIEAAEVLERHAAPGTPTLLHVLGEIDNGLAHTVLAANASRPHEHVARAAGTLLRAEQQALRGEDPLVSVYRALDHITQPLPSDGAVTRVARSA